MLNDSAQRRPNKLRKGEVRTLAKGGLLENLRQVMIAHSPLSQQGNRQGMPAANIKASGYQASVASTAVPLKGRYLSILWIFTRRNWTSGNLRIQ